jgi:hypothetical protein
VGVDSGEGSGTGVGRADGLDVGLGFHVLCVPAPATGFGADAGFVAGSGCAAGLASADGLGTAGALAAGADTLGSAAPVFGFVGSG